MRADGVEGSKVRKRTLANLSALPAEQVELLRRSLKGERFLTFEQPFQVVRNVPHGHVEPILGSMGKMGMGQLISSRPCREQALVPGMIAARLLLGASKPATVRLWHTTTLAEEFRVQDADGEDLYRAMDWLLARQGRIEKKLARRHLAEGGWVLYDVSSSDYVEWHMRRALAPIRFEEDDKPAGEALRDSIVAPAQRSPKAERKARRKRTEEGMPVHSFQSLLKDLAMITRNRVSVVGESFEQVTNASPVQQRAFELLGIPAP